MFDTLLNTLYYTSIAAAGILTYIFFFTRSITKTLRYAGAYILMFIGLAIVASFYYVSNESAEANLEYNAYFFSLLIVPALAIFFAHEHQKESITPLNTTKVLLYLFLFWFAIGSFLVNMLNNSMGIVVDYMEIIFYLSVPILITLATINLYITKFKDSITNAIEIILYLACAFFVAITPLIFIYLKFWSTSTLDPKTGVYVPIPEILNPTNIFFIGYILTSGLIFLTGGVSAIYSFEKDRFLHEKDYIAAKETRKTLNKMFHTERIGLKSILIIIFVMITTLSAKFYLNLDMESFLYLGIFLIGIIPVNPSFSANSQ